MKLTDSMFIEELIICIKSDEAVTASQRSHPDAWAARDYAGRQMMRRAIAGTVRASLQSCRQGRCADSRLKDKNKTDDTGKIRNMMIE